MSKEKITVRVKEIVECFKDCWDYSTESHYTKDWEQEVENHYEIEVEMDEDGNIFENKEELDFKVRSIADGEVLDFEILY